MSPLKRAAGALLGTEPLAGLLRRRARRPGTLSVLCYHTLGPDGSGIDAWTMLEVGAFRRQVAWLTSEYDIVSLDAALETPNGARPRAVLTFDDGDRGLAEHLPPLLEALEVPVTVYVATGQIETGTPYWFDRVMNALQAPGPFEIQLEGLGHWVVGPAYGAARWAVIGDLLETLKQVDPVRRQALTDAVVAAAPAPAPPDAGPGQGPALGPMTREALQALAAHPLVTIGAHSDCHNLLDQIPLAEAEASAARSRTLLQDWTGQEVCHFAYPNGTHTAALRAAMARLGFASAAALDMGLAHADADRFALPRIGIGRYDALRRIRLRLAGL